MTLLDRYIFRIGLGAFLTSLAGLTAVIWITQALRELDLVTGKGQTLAIFLIVTSLSLPAMVAVIAPVALFIAVIFTLNKLSGDSELIVMSAAGSSPRRLLRPFLALAGLVSLVVALVVLYIMPASFQELRQLITKVRADFVANIVKEGQFSNLDNNITFHYRERAGDALLGIFMQDRREPDRAIVYLAERGQAIELNGQSYLVLEKGSVHRQMPNTRDSSIVGFERYGIDLSALSRDPGEVVYKPRERSTTELLFPAGAEDYYVRFQSGRLRSELHERLSAWLYPIAMTLIAFAALGEARTTRQGRSTAAAVAVIAVVALRIALFAALTLTGRSPAGAIWVYALPLIVIAVCLALIFQGARVKALRARLTRWGSLTLMPRVPLLGRA
ncbi:MAG: LPS export ABC transporter permease LptF [Pseudomonadota bacterium]|nr:LPS export ABC transporter permease LptF [Pseudomonadota bacterium]